jgi:hypothetical protein
MTLRKEFLAQTDGGKTETQKSNHLIEDSNQQMRKEINSHREGTLLCKIQVLTGAKKRKALWYSLP